MHLLLEQGARTLFVVTHVALARATESHAQREAEVFLRLGEGGLLILRYGRFDQRDMARCVGRSSTQGPSISFERLPLVRQDPLKGFILLRRLDEGMTGGRQTFNHKRSPARD